MNEEMIEVLPVDEEIEFQKKEKKRPNILRLSLMGVLLAVLALGILWYTGMIDPLGMVYPKKSVKVNKPKASVKNKRSGNVIQRKTRIIPSKPRPSVSKKRAGTLAKKTVPSSAHLEESATKVAAPASLNKISLYPYSLYHGSYRTRERAKKAISMYSKEGLSPYWVKMKFKEKGIWFRVYSGYFEDRAEAETFRLESKLKDATVKNTQYANLISTYSDETVSLKMKVRSLKKQGYSPYVIRGHDGQLQLFVGGFLRKARAVTQHHELKSKGIKSRIVKR